MFLPILRRPKLALKITMANQFTNRPPFCDYLERYQTFYKSRWSKSQLTTQRVGLGRFDEWLKICDYKLQDLDWQKLLELHRYAALQGASAYACRRVVQTAKHALRWGIEQGELPQKIDDIYTFRYPKNNWDIQLPPHSEEFLSELEPTRPGAFKSHRFSHKVFHHFLKEKKLTYRQFKICHAVAFIKFLKARDFEQRSLSTMPLHVRTYLRWLYKKRKIKHHPDDIFPTHLMPQKVKSLPRPLEPELDKKLQDLLESTDDLFYQAILLIRRTGLRIKELRLLEFHCIQTDKKGRSLLVVPPVKLGAEGRVPLDEKTLSIIKKIQEMSLQNYKKKSDPKFLVIYTTGKPPRYERYSAAMTEICSRLKVKKWINLHALRHTYATSLLNAGLSITSLKEILGHKSINMSLIYAKVTQEKIHAEYQQAIQKMSTQHIPEILEPKVGRPEAAFVDLGAFIQKTLDHSDPNEIKRLKAIQNRLSKIKMELSKFL